VTVLCLGPHNLLGRFSAGLAELGGGFAAVDNYTRRAVMRAVQGFFIAFGGLLPLSAEGFVSLFGLAWRV